MPIDRAMFADKLLRYCRQFDVTNEGLSQSTGIPLDRLQSLERQDSEPTGDEVLILADFFKCDFKFFISNEKLAPFEQTESLFRVHGAALTQDDRWAIQEFLFLCECQEFLQAKIHPDVASVFKFRKVGNFYKQHAREATIALRRHLGYGPVQVPIDVYADFRRIGLHIFRRRLKQSNISGLFIRHPVAGPCVLVNYDEDVFRQRFSAAHEAGHALLDDADFVVSIKWNKETLSEIRANVFASNLLMPPEFLNAIPNPNDWNKSKMADWALRLRVNPESLAIALKDAGLISEHGMSSLRGNKIPRDKKTDPELPNSLSPRTRMRKIALLERGLSDYYVDLCFTGYERGIVTGGRLAEMLMVSEFELKEIAGVYGRRLEHGD